MKKCEERESFTLTIGDEKLFGILHRPLKIKKAPAILFCQGYEGNKCGKLGLYVDLAKELAKAGFIVARFDYRGVGDSEGDPSIISMQDKIDDTLEVIKFLASDSQVDPSRMGILGRSLGGAIAIKAAGACKSISAIVLWAPVFDGKQWLELWEKQQVSNSSVTEEMKNIPGEIPNRKFLSELFALSLSSELNFINNVPLLHIHGEKDNVVKFCHAINYKKACDAFKVASFVRLSETDHDFALSPDRKTAVSLTIEWFKQHLGHQ